MKKLIPAVVMLLISAMLMGTSTYAWFTMNTSVSATGMQVKAIAGGGLVIANYDGTTVGEFGNEATAKSYTDASTFQSLNPTSTINCTDWVYTEASDGSSYKKGASEVYSDVTSASTYYLLNKFVIQTAGGDAIDGSSLYICDVNITGDTPEATNALKSNLDKSLRVAVRYTPDWSPSSTGTSSVKFFAPLYAEDTLTKRDTTNTTGNGCGVKVTTGSGSGKSYDVVGLDVYGNTNFGTAKNGIKIENGTVSSKTLIEIFVYFEGEDTNNKTGNTADGVDSLNVEVCFKSVEEPSVSVAFNGTDTLTATVTNGTATAYAWSKCDTVDGTYSPLSGKTASTLTVDPATESGFYKCTATVGGVAIVSDPVKVPAP